MYLDSDFKIVPEGLIDNNVLSLVQVMASHWTGEKPLSEPRRV